VFDWGGVHMEWKVTYTLQQKGINMRRIASPTLEVCLV
jgi:hypothetical protein